MSSCFDCGSSSKIHYHHVVPKRRGGTKTVPLCEPCHMKVHGKTMNMTSMSHEKIRELHKEGKVYARVPYGFKVGKNKVLLENKKERKVLETIWALRDKSVSYSKIEKILNGLGYKRKDGKKWTRESIFSVVSSQSKPSITYLRKKIWK